VPQRQVTANDQVDAGTPTAPAGGTATDTASDAEIDGLDLQSDVADAARALKTKIPVLGTGAW